MDELIPFVMDIVPVAALYAGVAAVIFGSWPRKNRTTPKDFQKPLSLSEALTDFGEAARDLDGALDSVSDILTRLQTILAPGETFKLLVVGITG
ncbi:unnamed protein product [Vitrella brassicaformis CCMP3155]|uniref:Uncharacterized protein n=1 Tax=Vitrella brassicaformis (strain CCMP3155) TaxID=1169540 RepID=A0A0G4ENC9_VITBC|nr:unnamed protein product [Vitrella brassicaformis CCMP3155]|eukprot:CEL98336.1 unnamed protein product [Vitrella brassicaformis CCMP3155]